MSIERLCREKTCRKMHGVGIEVEVYKVRFRSDARVLGGNDLFLSMDA